MPSVKKTAVNDLELTEEYTQRDRKVQSTQRPSSKSGLKRKDHCEKDRCGTVRQKVKVPAPHIKPTHACVEKTIPCPTYSCDDVCVRGKVKPVKVGVKDIKLLVKPQPVRVHADHIDVKLKYAKPHCNNPTINVDVEAPCVVLEQQKVHVEVLEQRYSKDGPIVKVHCPPPGCYVFKPKVNLCIEEPGKYCMPEPEICVTYRDGCGKDVQLKASSTKTSHSILA